MSISLFILFNVFNRKSQKCFCEAENCAGFIGTTANNTSIEEQQQENLSADQTNNSPELEPEQQEAHSSNQIEQQQGSGTKRGRPVKRIWRRHAHLSMDQRKGVMSKEDEKKRKLRLAYIDKCKNNEK